jgi:D-serine deaminase-like pyridoxal phosphate-dependent protein
VWLASVADSLDVICLIDSVSGVRTLDTALGAAGCSQPLRVMVELGADGGRAGVRGAAAAREVCRAAQRASNLRVVGVEGYEGAVGSQRSSADLAAVDRYLDELRLLTVELADAGLLEPDGPVLVSAGGSKFFDRVIGVLGGEADFGELATALVLRSGCYIVHDHGLYAAVTPLGASVTPAEQLQPAIRLWAEVLSCPEPGLAIVGLGRRDASFDSGLPVLLAAVSRDQRTLDHDVSGRLEKLDDQHGYLRFDAVDSGFAVGDRLVFGISHPCTTFDRWRRVLLLDGQQRVTQVLETEFH